MLCAAAAAGGLSGITPGGSMCWYVLERVWGHTTRELHDLRHLYLHLHPVRLLPPHLHIFRPVAAAPRVILGGPTWACLRIAGTRRAEARLRRIVNKYGVPPATARSLLTSIIQGIMLYAAELSWNGQKGVEREYKRAINRMGRSTLGAYHSTPRSTVMGESRLTKALLNHRQARFTQRLYARPRDDDGAGDGPGGILTRERSALTARLRAAAALSCRETVESQRWSTGRQFLGRVIVDSRAGSLETASGWRRRDTVWTDGSRIEKRGGGSSVCLAVT